MKQMITTALFLAGQLLHAQNTIHAYAVADWRDGPVQMTSVFETTEAFTDAQLTERVKKEYPEFKEKAEVVIKRFATKEEADEDQRTLVAKYHIRGVLAIVHLSIAEKKKAEQGSKTPDPAPDN